MHTVEMSLLNMFGHTRVNFVKLIHHTLNRNTKHTPKKTKNETQKQQQYSAQVAAWLLSYGMCCSGNAMALCSLFIVLILLHDDFADFRAGDM